ncbi:MAG: tetratricopeptide repeat protein [Chlorobium sp.]|jgi:tetratricopeptide (TPR) repeat protein
MIPKLVYSILCAVLFYGTIIAETPTNQTPEQKYDFAKDEYTKLTSHSAVISSDAGIGRELKDEISTVPKLIKLRQFSEAELILDQVISKFSELMSDKRKFYVAVRLDSEYKEHLHFIRKQQKKEVIRVHISFADALQLKGYIAIEEKQWEKAIKFFETETFYAPYEVGALSEKGHVMIKLGKLEEAITLYEKAYAIALVRKNDIYESALALRGIGCALIDMGRLDEAIVVYEKSLKIEPGNPLALHELQYIRDKKEEGFK